MLPFIETLFLRFFVSRCETTEGMLLVAESAYCKWEVVDTVAVEAVAVEAVAVEAVVIEAVVVFCWLRRYWYLLISLAVLI